MSSLSRYLIQFTEKIYQMFESITSLFEGVGLMALWALPASASLHRGEYVDLWQAQRTDPPASATCSTRARYRSTSLYREYPLYEICYDSGCWQLIVNRHRGQATLVHQTIEGCTIALDSRPLNVDLLTRKQLKERTWSLYSIGPNVLHYATIEADIGFFFNVTLPSDDEAGEIDGINRTSQATAEAVLETFRTI